MAGLTDGKNVMEEVAEEEDKGSSRKYQHENSESGDGPPPSSGQGDSSPQEDKSEKDDEDSGAAGNGRKRRNRRKHKGGRHHRGGRKWKPYTKMTWEEKKSLEERETKRACMKREERFASGQAMAPYNTTQFLMDQHDSMDVSQLDDLEQEAGHADPPRNHRASGEGGSGSVESSDEYYDSPNDEEIFLQKDFTEAYENFHAERLQSLTKDELIKEHLELEAKIERMEKRSKEKERKNNNDNSVLEQTKLLEAEIKRLKEENNGLRKENHILKDITKGGTTEC